jgi:hypothetical protein
MHLDTCSNKVRMTVKVHMTNEANDLTFAQAHHSSHHRIIQYYHRIASRCLIRLVRAGICLVRGCKRIELAGTIHPRVSTTIHPRLGLTTIHPRLKTTIITTLTVTSTCLTQVLDGAT